MRRAGFFRPGQRVGIAVSGGADSVLLLDYARRFAREYGLSLAVVHFNHRLRGAESDADERFVKALAAAADLEFLRGEADVRKAARERGRNVEETARDLRYRFFFSLLNDGRLDRVATAHTANDQAETVLLRLLRGAGTRGLGGIYPVLERHPLHVVGPDFENALAGVQVLVPDGAHACEKAIIRPFLGLTRQEVRSEVEVRGLSYRVDATNLDPAFARNKIRMELLPWLEREFNPAVVRSLAGLADRSREDEDFLEPEARARTKPWRMRWGAEEKIPVNALTSLPAALQRRVLRQMIAAVKGNLRGVTHIHLRALCDFSVKSQSGKQMQLPQVVARKEFGFLVVGPASRAGTRDFSYEVELPGRISIPELARTFNIKIVTAEELQKAYNTAAESGCLPPVGLDPLKLSTGLVLRSWRPGDHFQPLGSHKPSKLKELLRKHRITLKERTLWPVLVSGGEIVWVRSFPPGSSFAAPAGSDKSLMVSEETCGEVK